MTLDVGEGAVCEYLPQEVILFDGANAAPRDPRRPFPRRDLCRLGFHLPGPPGGRRALRDRHDLRQTHRNPARRQANLVRALQHAGGSPIADGRLRTGRPVRPGERWSMSVQRRTMRLSGCAAPIGADGDGVLLGQPARAGRGLPLSRAERFGGQGALHPGMGCAAATSCQGKAASSPRIWAT